MKQTRTKKTKKKTQKLIDKGKLLQEYVHILRQVAEIDQQIAHHNAK